DESGTNQFDLSYHEMLRRILYEGIVKSDRTGTGTLSIFGHFQQFDLSKGFPLITTKKIFLKGIIHELLWMLSGSENIKYLQDHGVHIWDEWADEDGNLGPVYGSQWRRWKTKDGREFDQIDQIIDRINNKPWDRRIILNAWNVGEIDAMKLPPCHFSAQFNVTPRDPVVGFDGYACLESREPAPQKLNCLLSIRSWDTFLGGPFNIAQYALLTMMLAQVTNLEPGTLSICSGDTHIYLNHLDQVKLQLSREPNPIPKLILDPSVKNIDDFRYEHFKLEGYNPHPHIAGEV